MEPQEITPEWVIENLYMYNGDDITEYYSDETINYISWILRTWEDFDYDNEYEVLYEVLEDFHLKYKQ